MVDINTVMHKILDAYKAMQIYNNNAHQSLQKVELFQRTDNW